MIDNNVKNAIKIGSICSISYLAVYIARNLLAVVTPEMIDSGIYTIEYIALMSTGYMLFYAFGQLVNGAIGDKITSKYMITIGLTCAGICNLMIPYFDSQVLNALCYSLSGYFLSMIYGPLTKTVSENVLPRYATRCALGYTFASFFGSPCAGFVGMLFNWEMAFVFTAFILVIMAVVAFIMFTFFEKKKIIEYNKYTRKKGEKAGIKILLKYEIVKYSFVSILTGIIRTTVVFWIPTYLNQHIGLSTSASAGIFSLVTILMSLAPYVNNLIIYERVFNRDKNKTLLFMFSLSAVSFFMMFAVRQPMLNIIMLSLALMSNGGAATVLWSVYCPSLRDTGLVSTVTGYLDFLSYIGAAVSNIIFANAVEAIGWSNLILVWCSIAAFGVIISIQRKNKADVM